MKATDILYEEHRIIMTVLECLTKIIAEAEETGRLNAEAANTAITFFREFADGCHHAKEEDRLFIAMQEAGLPSSGGPIAVMLTEHDAGRHFVRGMARSVERAADGDSGAITEFTQNARDFIALLTAHIQKEDQVLFPMAGQVIAPSAADDLLGNFKEIESKAGGSRHADFLEVAGKLCRAYGVESVTDATIRTLKTELM